MRNLLFAIVLMLVVSFLYMSIPYVVSFFGSVFSWVLTIGIGAGALVMVVFLVLAGALVLSQTLLGMCQGLIHLFKS